MKQYKRVIGDLIAELNGLSALLTIMSCEFLEDHVVNTNDTIGDALFGLSSFADHIAEELDRIEVEQAREARR